MSELGPDTPPTPIPPPAQPGHRRTGRGRAILLSVVIFLCGAIVGGVGAMALLHRTLIKGRPHPEHAPALAGRHLQRKLDLTDEQAEEVRAILKRRFAALRTIRDRTHPHIQGEMTLLEDQVAEVLDERQAKEWRTMCSRFRHRFRAGEHRERRRGGPRHPDGRGHHGPPPPRFP